MLKLEGQSLPIYGKSYQGTYFFRIRKAKRTEATINEFDSLTIDIIILTVTDQPRAIIATSMAAGHTYKHPDAEFISKNEWDAACAKFHNELTANE